MSNLVVPVGAGALALVADDGHRPQEMPHHRTSGGEEDNGEPEGVPARAAMAPPLALPTDSPEALMPSTLFTATLFAQRMQVFARAAADLHHQRRTWTPPESAFRLRDRAV
jgi:hypothetical protein